MKPLLLIAHPGHELRIFEWVRRVKPHVVVLTHGDGSIGQPRLEDTRHLLREIDVEVRDDWIAPIADSAVYQALLGLQPSPLPQWLERLVAASDEEPFDVVVADEAEGYNPTHDVCRVLANLLVHRLEQSGRAVQSLEMPLVGHPCDPARNEQLQVAVSLDTRELDYKLDIMKRYAQRCSPILEQELQTMLDTFGEQAFAQECLYSAGNTPYERNELPLTMPYFERVGEERYRAGIYAHVIRAEHVRRLVQASGPGH